MAKVPCTRCIEFAPNIRFDKVDAGIRHSKHQKEQKTVMHRIAQSEKTRLLNLEGLQTFQCVAFETLGFFFYFPKERHLSSFPSNAGEGCCKDFHETKKTQTIASTSPPRKANLTESRVSALPQGRTLPPSPSLALWRWRCWRFYII